MKVIRNRKLYDTTTAELLGTYESPYYTSDYHYYQESLYRKKNGEFFLAGWGGPMTRYAEDYCDGRGSGSDISPIDAEEAKDWVESHLSAAAYIEIFGVVEE